MAGLFPATFAFCGANPLASCRRLHVGMAHFQLIARYVMPEDDKSVNPSMGDRLECCRECKSPTA